MVSFSVFIKQKRVLLNAFFTIKKCSKILILRRSFYYFKTNQEKTKFTIFYKFNLKFQSILFFYNALFIFFGVLYKQFFAP